MPNFTLADIRFLLSRVNGEWLPEEQGGLAPLGPTGIRDVQGTGNNNVDMTKPGFWFGAADTLFPRLTFNRLTDPTRKNDLISDPFANTPRGIKIDPNTGKQVPNIVIGNTTTVNGQTVDALNPRNISNLIADSSNSEGFTKVNADFKLLDDPTGRISPISGPFNPLPYSNWMSQFGQFFDHGLDFVSKGVDGQFSATLMPGDSIYSAPSATAITGARNNTVNVTIGDGSSDDLLQKLGFLAVGTAQSGDIVSWKVTSKLTNPTVNNGAFTFEGSLVLNNTLIKIQAMDEQDLLAQINLWTPTTGVTATLTPFPAIDGVSEEGAYQFTLAPARAESFNQTSPFVDLSQNYGSDASRTVFLREYIDATAGTTSITDITTGRLLNAGATTGDLVGISGMADWTQVKANAAKLGIILHDADISAIPLIALDNNGNMILDADGMPQLVALHRVTGEIVYIKDTTLANNDNLTNPSDYVLMTTKHAFLNDMGIRLPGLTEQGAWDANRDLANSVTKAALGEHLVSGDGRLNENIGLTAVHEVFLNEHNRVLEALKVQYGFTGANANQPAGGWTWTDPLTGQTSTVTGESLFQQAKLVVEMEYQHMVFAEFARKLSPNIAGFAGVNPLINADIPAEFAHAVYRLGHSMLPESVGMRQYTVASNISFAAGTSNVTVNMGNHGLTIGTKITLTGIDAAIGGVAAADLNGKEFTISGVTENSFTFVATGLTSANGGTSAANGPDSVQIDVNKGLIDAFLSPGFYDPGATAAWLGTGSSAQVGMRIDEKVTDALRDNLLRQPLDLATLNLMRGRDAGMPTLNEMRGSLQAVAPVLLAPTLAKYTSWLNFRDNLKGTTVDDQNVTVKNFMMAYASDDILTKFAAQAVTNLGQSLGLNSVPTTLAGWYALRESTVPAEQDAYMAVLKAATNLAFADATFMGSGASANKDFNRIDAWIGGLAEKEVLGGMLGSTFDAVFAMTMLDLQNGDFFYYLGRVPATEFFNDGIDGSLLSDLVARSTGAKYLYGDIFSVADKTVMMADAGVQRSVSQNALANVRVAPDKTVYDAAGNVLSNVTLGTAGYGGTVFYGNQGSYIDARGVLNANGSGNASETIVGTATADDIRSLGGNDTVWGEGGGDSIQGGSGTDFLHGGDGNDNINGGTEDDFIYGEAGNDLLRGDIGIDTMFGGDGNDEMYGGLDADLMVGGTGDDLMYGGDGIVDPVTGILDPEPAVAVALVDDALIGGSGNDTMYGGGGWDNLAGESGNDILDAGAGGNAQGGRDLMNGGEGDDLYIIGDLANFVSVDIADNGLTQLQRVNGIAPTDALRVNNGIGVDEVRFTQQVAGDIILGATNNLGVASAFTGVERVVIGTNILDPNGQPTRAEADRTGTAAINIDASLANPGINVGLEILANAADNIIIGTAFGDTIDGGAGIDTMEGGLGNDTYIVDDGADVLIEATGGGTDTVSIEVGSNIDYTLAAELENLILNGNGNGQDGTGNNLDNVITGSAFNNVLSGNAGNDTLNGEGGNDTLNGGDGNDTLNGGAGTDTLNGGAGNDTLNGDAGNDTLNGDAGSDTLNGGDGSDRIVGGADVDVLSGGAGSDVFAFTNAAHIGNNQANLERITDFVSGTDRIDLSAIDANTLVNNNQAFTFIGETAFVAPTGGTTAAQNAGKLRYDSVTNQLQGDTDGDGVANFSLLVLPPNGTPGPITQTTMMLQASDFVQMVDIAPAVANQAIAEGTGTNSTHTFTIKLSGPVSTDTYIRYAVTGTGGNAANGTDFGGTLPSGFVRIPAGQTVPDQQNGQPVNNGLLTITVIGDATVESNESFQVTISNITTDSAGVVASDAVVLGITSATSTINNDDVATGITINGDNRNNTQNGGAGNDTLNGNGGNDTQNGFAGNDTLNGGAGNDTMNGGDGDDLMNGGAGFDTMNGGAGVDTFRFASAAEIGGAGTLATVNGFRDQINAFQTGVDKIELAFDANTGSNGTQQFTWIGNAAFSAAGQLRFDPTTGLLQGNTTGTTGAEFSLRFNNGVTVAQGDIIGLANPAPALAPAVAPASAGPVPAPAAIDPVPTPAPVDPAPVPVDPAPVPAPVPLTLNGGATADTLVGGEADDVLNGNGGNDTLIGNGGADRLNGGAGFDNMDGGAGADLFVFNAAIREIGTSTSAHDVILNFESGVDKIDLSAIDANAGFLAFGDQAFTWIGDAAFTAAGQIRFDAATGLLEGNVNANRAADFAIEIRGGVVSVTDVIL